MASLAGLEGLPGLVTTPASKRPRSPGTGGSSEEKRIKVSEKDEEKFKIKEKESGKESLLVCFDLEMSDGSFASEIFQVNWT